MQPTNKQGEQNARAGGTEIEAQTKAKRPSRKTKTKTKTTTGQQNRFGSNEPNL